MMETYFCLGLAGSETGTYADDGILGCMSANNHPVHNFCFAVRPTTESVTRLRDLALIKPGYCVYMLPSLERPSHEEMLTRAGFVQSNELHVLTFPMSASTNWNSPEETFTPVVGHAERLRFATMITALFFDNADPDFLSGLADVTASENGCELLAVHRASGVIGGIMLSRRDRTFGIYNIAVANRLRHRGIGTSMVRTLVKQGVAENRIVTLQCHKPLVPWYENMGFRRLTTVPIYRLS